MNHQPSFAFFVRPARATRFNLLRLVALAAVVSLGSSCSKPAPKPPGTLKAPQCQAADACSCWAGDVWRPPCPPPQCGADQADACDCFVGAEWKGCPEVPAGPQRLPDLLRTGNGSFVNLEGVRQDLNFCSPCCMPWTGGWTFWPMPGRPEFLEWARDVGRCNVVEFRYGPFFGDASAEPQFADIGGPYLDAGPLKADLDQWNPLFWDRNRAMLQAANDLGFWVILEVAGDGWAIKHATAHEWNHPWRGDQNVQGEDLIAQAGRVEITPGSRFDDYIRKVVAEACEYAATIFVEGNEIGQVPGYSPTWTLSARKRTRFWEQELGCPVKMFGSNAGPRFADQVLSQDVDWISLHQQTPVDGPWFDKPVIVTEYNPSPPLKPETVHALACSTREAGEVFGAWRHTQSDEDWEQTLRLIAAGCEGQTWDACPFPVWVPTFVKVNTSMNDATPMVRSSAYCRETGQAPKTTCPVRAEGDPFRLACELESMGVGGEEGRIYYWLTDVVGTLKISRTFHDGFKFNLEGTGSATLNCSFPAAGGAQKCRAADGSAIKVSR